MKKRSLIFIIVYLAYTSIYIARLNLSMASPEWIASGLLDSSKVGILGGVFLATFGIGRLLNGFLGDKVRPGVMIFTGLVLTGVSNFIVGTCPPFIAMCIFWGTNAYAQSMLWSSVLVIVASLYEEDKEKKSKTAYMVTSVSTGNILGIVLSTLFIEKIGVKSAFYIPAVVTLVLGFLVLVFTNGIKNNKTETKHISTFELLKNKSVLKMLVPSVCHGTMKDNISVWMAVYFVSKYAIDLKASAGFVLLIPVVGLVGRLIYPSTLAAFKNNENRVSVLGFIVTILSIIPLFFGVKPIVSAVCLSLIYAAVSMINTSLLSIFPMRFASSGNVSSVSGLMDFATYVSAGISSIIYGFVGFNVMFVSWIAVSVISLFVLRKEC